MRYQYHTSEKSHQHKHRLFLNPFLNCLYGKTKP